MELLDLFGGGLVAFAYVEANFWLGDEDRRFCPVLMFDTISLNLLTFVIGFTEIPTVYYLQGSTSRSLGKEEKRCSGAVNQTERRK